MEMKDEGVTAPKIPDAPAAVQMQAGSVAPDTTPEKVILAAVIQSAFWSNSQDKIKEAMMLMAKRIEAIEAK